MAAFRHVFLSVAVALIVSMMAVLAIPTPTFAQIRPTPSPTRSPIVDPTSTPTPTKTPVGTPTPTPAPSMPEMPGLAGEQGAFLAVLVLLAVLTTLTATVNVVFLSMILAVLVGYAYQAVWVGLVVWLATYVIRVLKNLIGG
ncbi:MAG: hypothetical protein RML46_12520 [Anaerolineae bacterium]|nr:hypothetical protein [Anaerolineae bacterium]